MSFFDEDAAMAASGEQKEDGSPLPLFLLIGLILLPALPVALGFYLGLRLFRLRLSVLLTAAAILTTIAALLWSVFDVSGDLMKFFMNPSHLKENLPNATLPLILMYGSIGAWLGCLLAAIPVLRMKKSPYLTVLEGSWMYHFEYRRTPLQWLRRRKNISILEHGIGVDEEKVPLGIDEKNSDQIVYRYYQEATSHTLITGGTGTGKTAFTMQPLIRGDIENHVPVVIIDFKRDPVLASRIATWTKNAGGKFYHFTSGNPEEYDIANSQGQSYYDPLAAGSAAAQADMLLGMREWDSASEHYKNNLQQLLQVTFNLIAQANPNDLPAGSKVVWDQGGIHRIASIVSDTNYIDLVEAAKRGERDIYLAGRRVLELLNGKQQLAHAKEELAGQIRTIVASQFGRWVKTPADGTQSIDLYKLSNTPGSVVLFSLNSDSEANFSKYFGSLIMSDLTNVSAKRRSAGNNNPVNVYIDEFQIVPPESVAGLLEKSRASGIGMTLAQQSLKQIISSAAANGEAYLGTILDNCSNFVIHAGSEQDSAERLAGIVGKGMFTDYRATNRNKSFFLSFNWKNKRDSVVNTSEVERWIFDPSEFMSLTKSVADDPNSKATAVVINKSTADPAFSTTMGALARRVWLVPRDDNFENFYVPHRQPVTALPTTQNENLREYVFHEGPPADLDFEFEPPAEEASDDGGFVFEFEDDPTEEAELRDMLTEQEIQETALPADLLPQKPLLLPKKPAPPTPPSGGGLPRPAGLPLPNFDKPPPPAAPRPTLPRPVASQRAEEPSAPESNPKTGRRKSSFDQIN